MTLFTPSTFTIPNFDKAFRTFFSALPLGLGSSVFVSSGFGSSVFVSVGFDSAGLLIEGDSGTILVQTLRIGKNGRKFYMLKFRTLRKKGLEELPEDAAPKYTVMGRIVKALGFENLPNAWNILWGNMSVVGVNAPTLPEFLDYSHEDRNIMSMKPGVVGLWQIQKNHYTKSQSNENYVDNWSLFMDAGIIIRSLKLFFTK